eukprot:Amastigsp_a8556_4.p2 type:complete len:153 gc:universal Amastigsp_a8556_4:274-732(+)
MSSLGSLELRNGTPAHHRYQWRALGLPLRSLVERQHRGLCRCRSRSRAAARSTRERSSSGARVPCSWHPVRTSWQGIRAVLASAERQARSRVGNPWRSPGGPSCCLGHKCPPCATHLGDFALISGIVLWLGHRSGWRQPAVVVRPAAQVPRV